MTRDRGQAYTLEAVAAGTVLLASIVFALQVTAVTPLTASTASQHIENQQGAVVEGVFAGAKANETLKPTLLFMNDTSNQFFNTTYRGQYTHGGPPTTFGATLNRTFHAKGIAFNLDIHWTSASGVPKSRDVITMGVPSDSAVSRTTAVTLYDDDHLREPTPADSTPVVTNRTVGNTSLGSSYPRDVGSGPLYNVVEVEVTVWRM